MQDKKRVVILGGGVCGLYSALTLQRAGVDSVIIERAPITGGLATAPKVNGNYHDYGVHMFHAHDEEIFADIKKIMGDERLDVNLDAKIRWQGRFYHYPLQFKDLVFGMNKLKLINCVCGLFFAQIRYKIFPKTPRHALDALNQLYGKALTNFFFREFTERYWGIPTKKLSATFITTKMPRLTAVDVVKKLLSQIGIKEKKGLTVDSALSEEVLTYSKTGAETMTRKLTGAVEKAGAEIITSAEVSKINIKNNEVESISYKDKNGKENKIACSFCISTIPIKAMTNAIRPKAPEEVIKSANSLRYKAIAIYGVLLKKARAIEGLYIYYRNHCFHRVCEPKNAGMVVEPEGHTLLIIEMTCDIGDAKWNKDPKIVKQMIQELEDEKILTKDEVVDVNLIKYDCGYALYDLGFEEHLDKVKGSIAKFSNFRSVGRQGGFCFPGMHKSMRIGKDTAYETVNFLKNKIS